MVGRALRRDFQRNGVHLPQGSQQKLAGLMQDAHEAGMQFGERLSQTLIRYSSFERHVPGHEQPAEAGQPHTECTQSWHAVWHLLIPRCSLCPVVAHTGVQLTGSAVLMPMCDLVQMAVSPEARGSLQLSTGWVLHTCCAAVAPLQCQGGSSES